jgi:xylulokinase
VVAQGRSPYGLLEPAPNWYEQDAEKWWTATSEALQEALAGIDTRRVQAVCIAHQRESFVPVTGDGLPTRNAILWLDERSRDQVEWLAREFGRDAFHKTTGKPLTTNPSLTKVAWLHTHEPQGVRSAAKVLDTHAFLVHRLTGAFRTSVASADPMGLVDLRTGTWSRELVALSGLTADQLPELAPPGTIIGRVTREAADATGLCPGLPVVAGAGDGQCAGLGVNAQGGRASLNLGTAVVSGRTAEAYAVSPAFRTLHAAAPEGYFLETVIQGGAFTVSWFTDQFFAVGGQTASPASDFAALETAAEGVAPGASGLILVPYWNHAMTPYWDAAATGITIGWTGTHTPAHFYRAILEGIAYEQRLLGEGVTEATGLAIQEYAVLGGGSRSRLWCQILADVTGIPIRWAATGEATSLGAGILAAAAVDWYADVERAAEAMTRTVRGVRPSPGAREIYDALYREVYRGLFLTLQPILHRLADIRDGVGRAAPEWPEADVRGDYRQARAGQTGGRTTCQGR